MKNCIPVKNPLVRNGTSQRDRLIKALVPDQAPIDDRSIEEIINFLFRFGKMVNYYDLDNQKDGDWQCFFEFDSSITLAVIIARDADSIERNYAKLEAQLLADRMRYDDENDHSCSENPDPENYQALINYIFLLAKDIQRICHNIPSEQVIKKEVQKIIYDDLVNAVIDNIVQSALEKLIAYDKGLLTPNNYATFISNENENSCAATWCLTQIGYDCIEFDDLYDMSSLRNLFQIFYTSFLKVQQRAKYYFDLYLKDVHNHPPHITMFLTFLHLFKHLQEDLNNLTSKHLRYYYETVLCLKRKEAVPDQVHVIFEMARNFNQHQVKAESGLIAQKDDEGNDRIYKLVEEIVVNQAQVAEIKTTYLHIESNKLVDRINNQGRLFAAPVAKTVDGIETEFDNETSIRWSALGGLNHSPEVLSPYAEVGFAISSPILVLNEGLRVIKIDLVFNLSEGETIQVPENNPFSLFISSVEEGFINIPANRFEDQQMNVTVPILNPDSLIEDIRNEINWAGNTPQEKTFLYKIEGNKIQFRIVLTPSDLPLLAFDQNAEDLSFKAKWPTVKIVLNHEATNSDQQQIYPYADLRDKTLKNIDLAVVAKDVRNLVLENDKAQLDPNKQVLPFGISPKVIGDIGSNFYIGSDEVFKKSIDQLTIDIEWADLPSDFSTHYQIYDNVLGTNTDNNSFQFNLYKLENRSFQLLELDQSENILFQRESIQRLNVFLTDIELHDIDNVSSGQLNGYTSRLLVDWGIIDEGEENNLDLINRIYIYLKRTNIHIVLIGLISQKVDLNIKLTNEVSNINPLPYLINRKIRTLLKLTVIGIKQLQNDELTGYQLIVRTSHTNFSKIRVNVIHDKQNPYLPKVEKLEKASQQRGFLRMELAGSDFFHDKYNDVLTTQSIIKSTPGAIVTGTPNAETPLPEEPYTPTINSISIDYFSQHTIDLSCPNNTRTGAVEHEQFFHITPFGYKELKEIYSCELDRDKKYFLPQFERPTSAIKPNPKLKRDIRLTLTPNIAQPLGEYPGYGTPTVVVNPGGSFTEIPTGEAPTVGTPTPTISVPAEQPTEAIEVPIGASPSSVLSPAFALAKGQNISFNRIQNANDAINEIMTLANGNLYIGFENLKPKQTLSLLFQVLEGSGNNELTPPDIEWSYLVDNEWMSFAPFEILMDTTKANPDSKKSLLRSGIVRFSIPKTISNKNTTILNPIYHWVRASSVLGDFTDPSGNAIKISPAALPDLVDIRAQAALATFEDQDNSLNHLKTALDPKSISQLEVREIPVKSVEQPYASFDGRFPEADNDFFRRISERLRHKDRAITVWDYERLTLEKFPQIYKVKCISHSDYSISSEMAPGRISVAVIPNLSNKNTFNPAEPRVPIGVRDEIEVYLREKTNLFVACEDHLKVVNPLYEELQVHACLKFKDGLDQEFYRYQLNKDLKAHLAPWAFDDNAEITFGGSLHTSLILNFIEERDYVDVIIEFNVVHFDNESCEVLNSAEKSNNTKLITELIVPTTSRSILTTYNSIDDDFDYEHNIIALSAEEVIRLCTPRPRVRVQPPEEY